MAKKKPTLVLIDAHAIIHRAYHALPELTTPKGEPAGALYGLSAMLVKLLRELKPDYAVAAYDLPGPTHRHEAYKEYKATRVKTEDALVAQLDRSRDVFGAFHVPVYEAPGFEADDVIGTLATALKKDYDIIIASGDMDTLQLVDGSRVKVFTLRKGLTDTVLYDEAAVKERFGFAPELIADFKGLRGDPSDNIIGIPGIGEKTATTLITAYGSIEEIYKALGKDAEKFREKTGLTERIVKLLEEHKEEAEFSKVLATIRADAPVSFEAEGAAWRSDFTADHAVSLFTELGFRSLIGRVQALATTGARSQGPGAGSEADSSLLTPESTADSLLCKESAVMLWLLHSDITNPSREDILNNTGTTDIASAHAKLLAEISREKLDEVYENIEKPLIPVIESLNARGVLIDRAHLSKLSEEYHKELDAIAAQVFKEAGVEFNLNSPKQLGEILFEKLDLKGGKRKKTATGQYSTRESELQKLSGEHPIIEKILEYREWQKLLSTYIDAIPPLLGEDSRLRTTFVQTGTTTGRLSSREPNLQNIPIKSESGRRIRRAFVAPEGSILAAFDYSQIELRIAAFMSGDEKLKEVFIRGEDIHSAVAAEIFSVPPEQVDYEMRRRAKVINFGILYGMGVNALRESLQCDRTEAQSYLNRYFSVYAGLSTYLTKTKASATRLGYTTTFFGRKRHFPGLKSRLPHVKAQAERMAINAPFQGTQSDIIKIAMVRIDDMLNKEFPGTASLVLQIHDELMFEINQEALESVAPKIKKLMESVLTPEETGGVPIIVTSEAGPNWAELEKI